MLYLGINCYIDESLLQTGSGGCSESSAIKGFLIDCRTEIEYIYGTFKVQPNVRRGREGKGRERVVIGETVLNTLI